MIKNEDEWKIVFKTKMNFINSCLYLSGLFLKLMNHVLTIVSDSIF